jgi:PAS domain S-box-containing protein
MESKSDRQAVPLDPSSDSVVQTYEQTVERGFRWLLKALVAWIVLESTFGAAFFFVRKAAALAIGLTLAITYLTDLELLRRGRFKAASWSFILATWLAAFVIAIFRGGMGSQYMVLLLAITIVAGWLLGGRSMLLFAGLSLGSTLILAILQTLGVEAPTYFSGCHPLGVWLFFGFSLTTTVVPLKHILGSLRGSVSAIRASEEKYRALVHSLDGIVWEADAQTLQFKFVSQSAERILGYPLALWIDDPAFWQHHLFQEDCRKVLHLCGSAGQSLGEFEFQCRMIAADGRTVWLHNKVQVLTQNGVQAKLRGIMMDISRHAQVEAERKRAEESLA